MTGLEVWNAVKKYLNLYHHQAIKENIDVETVEGMPINIIEKELKALEILKPYCIVADYKCENPEDRYELAFCKKVCITEEEYKLLKEVLL